MRQSYPGFAILPAVMLLCPIRLVDAKHGGAAPSAAFTPSTFVCRSSSPTPADVIEADRATR